MDEFAPLPVAIPLLVATLLIAGRPVLGRRADDIISIAVSAAVAVICSVLLWQAQRGTIVYWFGGWTPHRGVALGISFVIDPLGAALATLVAVLVTASFVFTWHYFEALDGLYHSLMLVFLGAMVGFCLTGDIFNLFVLFELMGGAAFALTGYKVEDTSPLQGALNFAITNTIGAFWILIGIALLYGRTGALNLAQIGQTLAGKPADGLVIVAFVLITCGLLIKAAIVPLHFWIGDAHAVAPSPVCVLFSGVMVELGLYGVARVYWTVFAGPLGPHAPAVRGILIGVGTLTAVIGALMCFAERHLKRLLAFSTVSHSGLFLIGIATLAPQGLAGTAIYVLAHGFTKGALFMGCGLLLNTFGSVDVVELQGKGRIMPRLGILFALGALSLAEVPPFGTFLGKSLLEEAADKEGLWWVPLLVALTAAIIGGAVLRVVARVWLGWGSPRQDDSPSEEERHEERESQEQPARPPMIMLAPVMALLALACLTGLVPGLHHHAVVAAVRFEDRAAYAGITLGLHLSGHHPAPDFSGPDRSSALYEIGTLIGAFLLAAVALFRRQLPSALGATANASLGRAITGLRLLHDGHIGDYVMWLVIGVSIFGGICALTLN
ncbi:MAG TPA: proton-conducting transporter membrane subunit [Chloroflexota bacterium]|nr:proton-conducting transporter membrane subunit [Chloroflexota bacterium]